MTFICRTLYFVTKTVLLSMKTFKNLSITSTLFILSILFITSCKPDKIDETLKVYGKVMLVHAAPGVPAFDLLIGGVKKNTDSIVYTKNSAYYDIEVSTSNYVITTKYSKAGNRLDSAGVKAIKNTGFSYFTYIDNDAAKSVRVLASTDNLTLPAAGKAKVRFVNLIPDIPNNVAVDVEAVAPGAVPTPRNDFTNVSFKTIKDFVEITKGTYDFKIKQTGTTNVILTVRDVVITEGKLNTFVANGFAAKLNTDPLGPKVTVVNNN